MPTNTRKVTSNEFNMLAWSHEIPLCDDLWLGMQARNIAIVDFAIIRDIETEALEAYLERERTPSDILLPLSALSQMWVFSLYEFLRTWRQRATEILKIADMYLSLPAEKKGDFLNGELKKVSKKMALHRIGLSFYRDQVERISEPAFVDSIRAYRADTESLFRSTEALRVTLAKHEVPKTSGLLAETPGYGRMSYLTGSIYWFITLKDGSQFKVDRRELSNSFLRIRELDEDCD